MSEPAPQPATGKRRRLLPLIIVAAVLVTAVVVAWRWFMVGQYFEATDNAYVGGNLVQITSRRDGVVTALHADEMDAVKSGEPLVTLDNAMAKAALDQAKAALAEAVRQEVQQYAHADQQRALITLREDELQLAQDTQKRREAMSEKRLLSVEELRHAELTTKIAAANLEVARRDLATTTAQLQKTPVAQQPAVMGARAQLRNAYLEWRQSTIPAPVAGYVAKRSVQLGQSIKSGETLMALVPLQQLWVDANFKEDQLDHLRIGQPVTLSADLYGDEVRYHGKVAGIALGTGAAFALLPPQNASGNWIKIVQRVPVRIALDQRELAQHPLRLGLSMRVEVDTHERQGPVLKGVAADATATAVYAVPEQEIEQLIDTIVRANLGSHPAHKN